MQNRTPTLRLEFIVTSALRPECEAAYAMMENATERSLCHLDAMTVQVTLADRIVAVRETDAA